MPAWTRADVRRIAPEFVVGGATPTPDATIDAFIVIADRQIAEQNWLDRAIDAGAYLTAHMMVTSGIGPYAATSGGGGAGTTGPIQSVTVGQVSVTYGSASSGSSSGAAANIDPWLALSKYGIAYAHLITLGVFGPQVL